MMRVLGLRLLFLVGALTAVVFVALVIFFRSLIRGARSFHPQGTICNAEVTALDEVVGPRLVGAARVRLSGSSEDENSPNQTILGMAIKFPNQDLPTATFESFLHASEATKNTNVADYLANQFASVSPWRVHGLGVMWLRALPDPAATTPKTGTRVERLDADIAAGRAKFTLEARVAPNADGALRSKLVEIRLTERLPVDDPSFKISMFRTGGGLVPTGFRNGVRAIVYPVSQFARHLRGH
jgi:hypothetical protein